MGLPVEKTLGRSVILGPDEPVPAHAPPTALLMVGALALGIWVSREGTSDRHGRWAVSLGRRWREAVVLGGLVLAGWSFSAAPQARAAGARGGVMARAYGPPAALLSGVRKTPARRHTKAGGEREGSIPAGTCYDDGEVPPEPGYCGEADPGPSAEEEIEGRRPGHHRSRVVVLEHRSRRRSVRLRVQTPARGQVVVSGRWAQRVRLHLRRAQVVSLAVHLNRSGRRQLIASGNRGLKARLRVSFTPGKHARAHASHAVVRVVFGGLFISFHRCGKKQSCRADSPPNGGRWPGLCVRYKCVVTAANTRAEILFVTYRGKVRFAPLLGTFARWRPSGRVTFLGGHLRAEIYNEGPQGPVAGRPIALAGPYVAFSWLACRGGHPPPCVGVERFARVDIKTGVRLKIGLSGFITKLVITAKGTVAWIEKDVENNSSPLDQGPPNREVRVARALASRPFLAPSVQLASSPEIAPRSLALSAGRLFWTEGGKSREAQVE